MIFKLLLQCQIFDNELQSAVDFYKLLLLRTEVYKFLYVGINI